MARLGGVGARDEQPPWQVVRTDVDANNGSGQKHYLLDDGSILAAGYAPTIAHDPVHGAQAGADASRPSGSSC